MQKPKLIEKYYNTLLLTFNVNYSKWYSIPYETWYHGYEFNFIKLGIDQMFFNTENWYYDGNSYKSITLFWIEIGYGFIIDYEEYHD